MKSSNIPYSDIQILSPLISDYVNKNKDLDSLYHTFPTPDNILHSAKNRITFSDAKRKTLVEVLQKNYRGYANSDQTNFNIKSLLNPNTFTITTGHQLNFATGPLYTIFKIVSVINMTETLNKRDKENYYVPVFWLATEDHDFEEINHTYLFQNKVSWQTSYGNACGRLGVSEIKAVIAKDLTPLLEKLEHGDKIIKLLQDCYQEKNNLSEATFKLYHALFDSFGLIILDADNASLKKHFAPIAKKELTTQCSKPLVEKQNELLKLAGHKGQAHARNINLFLLTNGKRERIVKRENGYELKQSKTFFTEKEILTLLDTHPEMFSPNVILRPVYQECILPNLVYIGGAGELSYWLQLKTTFEAFNTPFPALALRNSGLFLAPHHQKKLNQLNLGVPDLLMPYDELINKWTKANSSETIDLHKEKMQIAAIFEGISNQVAAIDPTLQPFVKSMHSNHEKGLQSIEKKSMKALKNKNSVALEQIKKLQEHVSPNGVLQERRNNIFELIAKHGFGIINEIKQQLNPFETAFTIFTK